MPVDVTHRRPRSNDKSDRLPYTKAAAHRAVRTTIGQELKALYEAPRDLPHENGDSFDAPDCAETVLKMQTVRRRNKAQLLGC
jgi:hypothetical protein